MSCPGPCPLSQCGEGGAFASSRLFCLRPVVLCTQRQAGAQGLPARASGLSDLSFPTQWVASRGGAPQPEGPSSSIQSGSGHHLGLVRNTEKGLHGVWGCWGAGSVHVMVLAISRSPPRPLDPNIRPPVPADKMPGPKQPRVGAGRRPQLSRYRASVAQAAGQRLGYPRGLLAKTATQKRQPRGRGSHMEPGSRGRTESPIAQDAVTAWTPISGACWVVVHSPPPIMLGLWGVLA